MEENTTAKNLINNIKVLVRGSYDIQKLRIQTGNRMVANFKLWLGQKPSESEDTLDLEGKKILLQIRASYKKITDRVKNFPTSKSFKGDLIISTFTQLCLAEYYIKLEDAEKSHFKRLAAVLEEYPIFTEYLKGVSGVGPAMAGVLISEFNIHKAETPSCFWKYSGLDVAPDGRGRSKKKEHLVETSYINKDGEEATKMGITFNPFLKTKLIGVLATSFLRSGVVGKTPEQKEQEKLTKIKISTTYKPGSYGEVYVNYKHRLETNPDHAEKTKGHRHNMAMRYMVKIFLIDFHKAWRKIEGLPVSLSYCEGKLGKFHSKPKPEQSARIRIEPTQAKVIDIEAKKSKPVMSKKQAKVKSRDGLQKKPRTG